MLTGSNVLRGLVPTRPAGAGIFRGRQYNEAFIEACIEAHQASGWIPYILPASCRHTGSLGLTHILQRLRTDHQRARRNAEPILLSARTLSFPLAASPDGTLKIFNTRKFRKVKSAQTTQPRSV